MTAAEGKGRLVVDQLVLLLAISRQALAGPLGGGGLEDVAEQGLLRDRIVLADGVATLHGRVQPSRRHGARVVGGHDDPRVDPLVSHARQRRRCNLSRACGLHHLPRLPAGGGSGGTCLGEGHDRGRADVVALDRVPGVVGVLADKHDVTLVRVECLAKEPVGLELVVALHVVRVKIQVVLHPLLAGLERVAGVIRLVSRRRLSSAELVVAGVGSVHGAEQASATGRTGGVGVSGLGIGLGAGTGGGHGDRSDEDGGLGDHD